MSTRKINITIIGLIATTLLIVLAIWYLVLDKTQKVYIMSILKQIRHMPGRYSV